MDEPTTHGRDQNAGGTPDDIDGTAEDTSGEPDVPEYDGDTGASSDRVGPVAGGRGTIGKESTYGDDDEAAPPTTGGPELT